MRSHLDAKRMAKALKSALEQQSIDISHAQALEIVAAQFGLASWHVLSAAIEAEGGRPDIAFDQTAPIFRIFDEDKAREFYVDFLGFTIDWEHRFGDNFPLYMQVSRAGLILHLSGHHGDATPGACIFVTMTGIRAYRRDLIDKKYTNMKPGIEEEAWGLVMTVTDPFGNRIRFCERQA